MNHCLILPALLLAGMLAFASGEGGFLYFYCHLVFISFLLSGCFTTCFKAVIMPWKLNSF